ncbi:MAG: PA0069 family radical SAM protein [Candidatus Eisenbacteria bacterium]|uniref:PA0069 family radical SAM protein n=1 Tax=Eiseniibacteriota bacterium TaxID=2212470 RepID=A0A7Y2EFN3_UNCEI|nr:PA0069 family radical SAM protein [Candidatus Eisenbacteria bacterium]
MEPNSSQNPSVQHPSDLDQPRPARELKGRGSPENPANRFEPIEYQAEVLGPDKVPTQLLRDTSKSILTSNNSPDIPFDFSVNPYRGCEHGCAYCYARPTHEYLGFSAGLDFETKLLVKENAAALLRKEFSKPKWEPQVVVMSGITDAYQPIEKNLELARACLEVGASFRNPMSIITKNHLVTRDIDILKEMNGWNGTSAFLSITTLDPELASCLEPRASTPSKRLEAVAKLSEAGIPVGVMVAPVIPGLNEHEIPSILKAAAEAGAASANYIVLRLPHGLGPLFEAWLERHRPNQTQKVLNRIRHIRGGKLNDPRFKTRMRGEGVYAKEVAALFELGLKQANMKRRRLDLNTNAFINPRPQQLRLFS